MSANQQNKGSLLSPLQKVGRRNRIQKLLEAGSWGLLCGAAVSQVISFDFLWGTGNIEMTLLRLVLLLGSGCALGLIVGFLVPMDASESARQVDRHYRFKDRLLTALHLLRQQKTTTPFERLQLADAAKHAQNVDPREVVPLKLPRNFFGMLGTVMLALAICLASPFLGGKTNAIAAEPLPEIVSAAETLQQEVVEKMAELAEKNPEEKPLVELAAKLQELAAQLDEVSTDRKESLATLSEMEAAIRAAMSAFQVEAVDASMREIADALADAEATRSASQSLKDENYAKAAQELENLAENAGMSPSERRAVSERMKTALKSISDRGQKSLLKAAQKMAEACENGNDGNCKAGACELAAESRKQALRKGICEGLQGKLALLGLCKSECNGGASCDKNGGAGTNKSNQAGKNWGTGAAGDPTSGEETNLDGNRERQNLTGMMGQGDSEFETLRSDESGAENTAREFRDIFKEYQKISEAVLETEPIPLGQRQMIRRYFESIRPDEEEN